MFGKKRGSVFTVYWLPIILVVLVSSIVFALIHFSPKQKSSIEYVSVNSVNRTIEYGAPLELGLEAMIDGSCSMKITYEIVVSGSTSILFASEKDINAIKEFNIQDSIILNLSEGQYILRTIFTCNDDTKITFTKFNVLAYKPNNIFLRKYINIAKNVNKTEVENKQQQKISELNKSSKIPIMKNDSIRLNICLSPPTQKEKDYCFLDSALATKNSTNCDQIFTLATKDSCYSNLAIKGDYALCEKITDQYTKNICESIVSKEQEASSSEK